MIDIKVIEENNYTILQLDGELDASSSIKLDEAIQRVINAQTSKILVDCKKLAYISSPGIGVFTSRINDQDTNQILIVLYSVNEKVLNVFQILGLQQLLHIVNSIEEAKKVIDEL